MSVAQTVQTRIRLAISSSIRFGLLGASLGVTPAGVSNNGQRGTQHPFTCTRAG
jgi:hypothetical protein